MFVRFKFIGYYWVFLLMLWDELIEFICIMFIEFRLFEFFVLFVLENCRGVLLRSLFIGEIFELGNIKVI